MVETLPQIFLNTVKTYRKENLLLHKKGGGYVAIPTHEFEDRVKSLSLGLRDLGLRAGDKLVLLAENGPDWVMTDFANLCLGGVTVPIYTSLMPEQIKYIINDSEARAVVCSTPELWEKIDSVRGALPKVEHYLTLGGSTKEGALSIEELIQKGKKLGQAETSQFERTAVAIRPGDLASIIYTSGTTGLPKGVMLSHGNFASNVKTLASVVEFNAGDTILSFLPLSHVLERMTTFAFLYKGCSIGYAESLETVAENLLEIRPQIMISVPRLFDKIYARVIDNVMAGSKLKKRIFFWALKTGKSCAQEKLLKRPISRSLQLRQNLASRLVFSKIVEKTGGRVRFFVSGGAPLSKDIAEFFYAMGLVILEGYGLTETSPVVSVNTFDNLKFGTVGKPIPGVELKIAADGEILVKGPNVMLGYYKKEAESQEAFAGGWFHTGDIGALDEEGYLVITDRKKDLIVTAGGKNVAPQPIENLLRASPYISNPVVVGASRKFISAIIVPNFEKLEEYAKSNDVRFRTRRELVGSETIRAFVMGEVNRVTPNLAPYERIKRIVLLDKELEIEADELTPTLKVKRNIIEQRYKGLIDELYKE